MNFNEEYKQTGDVDTFGTVSDFWNLFGRSDAWIGIVLGVGFLILIGFGITTTPMYENGQPTINAAKELLVPDSIGDVKTWKSLATFGSDEWVNSHVR